MKIIMKRLVKVISKLSHQYINNRYNKKLERRFYKKYSFYKNIYKIVYALTPSPRLKNIGDHAQVVAVYKWLNDNFPGVPIIEIDKNECISMIRSLKKIVREDDLIFIHSGGNLTDRYMWSETGRREIIINFPKNKIVSLPQTIYFTDTDKGKQEKDNTLRVYNKHNNLTVIGRDPKSGKIASEMFTNCKTFSMPDFVLYLETSEILTNRCISPKGIMICLRNDNESALTDSQKEFLYTSLIDSFEVFDTAIEKPIMPESRNQFLKDTLEYFDKFELVITDRLHGLIFAALLDKRIIVIPTVDHKLTSACEWFKSNKGIRFIEINELENIKNIIMEVKKAKYNNIDWKKVYFNDLKTKI